MSDNPCNLFTVPCLTCAGWTEHQLDKDELKRLTNLNEAEKETIRSIRTAESRKDDVAVESAQEDWRVASRDVSIYLSELEGKYGAS